MEIVKIGNEYFIKHNRGMYLNTKDIRAINEMGGCKTQFVLNPRDKAFLTITVDTNIDEVIRTLTNGTLIANQEEPFHIKIVEE